MTYSEKLQDPRWQKLRLTVLERDKWTCQRCGETKDPLHVHHKKYTSRTDPWDYPLDNFVALCALCHAEAGFIKNRIGGLLHSNSAASAVESLECLLGRNSAETADALLYLALNPDEVLRISEMRRKGRTHA